MLSKYVYAVGSYETRPQVKTIFGTSYNDAEERIIEKYIEKYDIDTDFSTYEEFCDWMNENLGIDFSDVEDYDTI
jgi:hypothetical protein